MDRKVRDQLGHATQAGEPLRDIVAEARRMLVAAASARVRLALLGGLAVRLSVPDDHEPLFARPYQDIDLFAARSDGRKVRELLEGLGYEANLTFNALHGKRRLLYGDPSSGRKVDVFVGQFAMCHQIPLSEPDAASRPCIALAELLLTKLQIVELNDKDQKDILTLLYHHPVEPERRGEIISSDRFAELLARDWGLWRTVQLNFERTRNALSEARLNRVETEKIAQRLDALDRRVAQAPKSRAWRMRSRLGDRVKWYEEPDEVA
jgi:hypothetical protein